MTLVGCWRACVTAGWRAAISAVLLVGVLPALAFAAHGGSTDARTSGDPGFCAPTLVRDFGLSSLPRAHEVPESGKPFGHGAVDIYGGGWTRVMPQPVSFGYGFSEHSYGGTVRLNWTVTAQLWAVDKTGATFQEVDSGELHIGRLGALHQPSIHLDPPKDRRGFYRFDLQITDEAGKELGSYDVYFKVVRPFWKPKLGLNRKWVHPGGTVLSRVENFGSETVQYGEAFRVQRFVGGQWLEQPDLLAPRWLLWLGALGAGGIGRCSSMSLPADASPGLYRIVKEVGPPPWPTGHKSFLLRSQFRVR